MSSDAELLGRDEVNDLDAILSITNTDVTEAIHTVQDNADAIFTWDYEKGARQPLEKLYEKAKNSMWNGTTDLPWELEVDQEKFARQVMAMRMQVQDDAGMDFTGTLFEKWTEKEWLALAVENQNWSLSQFMHGEQGALLCTAKIVETVP
ncbi:MAG: ferritin-like domain-containing protein, partial [Acidimicrobiales bacterium]